MQFPSTSLQLFRIDTRMNGCLENFSVSFKYKNKKLNEDENFNK